MDDKELMNNGNGNGENTGIIGTADTDKQKPKENIAVRVCKGVRNFVVKTKSTRGGRIVIGIVKGGAFVACGKKIWDTAFAKGYKQGISEQQVVITSGTEVPEEEIPEEEILEAEEANEMAEEAID